MEKDNLKQEVKESINEFYIYLRSQRYANQTIKTYISLVIKFFIYFGKKAPCEITQRDIIDFNINYILRENLSFSYQNQLINALKKFYEKIYNKQIEINKIERPRRGRPLPKVLSKEEVNDVLNTIINRKHRAILSLIYSAGLRRGELINLRIGDIDSKRMVIIIRNAKGNKDRIVGLSEKILSLLKNYYKQYKPNEYLFEGSKGGKYSPTSINAIFKRAKVRAGIKLKGGVHLLRHSFATHLHESGYDIRLIQELLGHKSSRTTEIYTHISTKSIKNVKSPFDDLNT